MMENFKFGIWNLPPFFRGKKRRTPVFAGEKSRSTFWRETLQSFRLFLQWIPQKNGWLEAENDGKCPKFGISFCRNSFSGEAAASFRGCFCWMSSPITFSVTFFFLPALPTLGTTQANHSIERITCSLSVDT